MYTHIYIHVYEPGRSVIKVEGGGEMEKKGKTWEEKKGRGNEKKRGMLRGEGNRKKEEGEGGGVGKKNGKDRGGANEKKRRRKPSSGYKSGGFCLVYLCLTI